MRSTSGQPATRAILLMALLLRLLVFWIVLASYPPGWLFSRGIEMGLLAQSLLSGQGFSSPFGGETGPTALLTPPYPALIACVFYVFGTYSRASAAAILLLQIGFSLLTVLLILRLALGCFGACAANLAGAFWAVSLPLLWMPTIFWETSLSTLLLTGMVGLALFFVQKVRTEQVRLRFWAGLGAYAGFASLVNPALLPALAGILGWATWQARERGCIRLLPGWLALLLVFAVWPVRNAVVLDSFIPLRSTLGLELWMGNRQGARGFLDRSVFPIYNHDEFSQYAARGEVRYMHEKFMLAWSSIEARPLGFVRLSGVRFLRFWSGTGTEDGSAWFAFHALVTTGLGAAGLLRLWRQGRVSLAALFLLPLLLFPLPYYATHAEFRYRLVIDPLLTILAGSAVCPLTKQASQ